jgi:glycosyltransferase involved in cell wall biosynthesis
MKLQMEIVCFSHLRWDFVFQRPQHLLTRLADRFRIFYVEEPLFQQERDHYTEAVHSNIHIVKPHLKGSPDDVNVTERQKSFLRKLFFNHKISDYILWYYTPMALEYSDELEPVITVYDCMDELSAFRFAHPALKQMEKELLNKADVVFCGGNNLYNAKKDHHNNIYAFPSSIDKKHFGAARQIKHEPADQASIPSPKFGFYGVIDERFDIELLKQVAERKPDWHFVLIGPVVKIDPGILPRRKNIHYLGSRKYCELPSYLSGWDISMISFALNESTQYISPTKTPEYLAGGKPVISTPIKDVVNSYGNCGLVHIINNADEFIDTANKELLNTNKQAWLQKVDRHLANDSWEITVYNMRKIIYEAITEKQITAEQKRKEEFAETFMLVKGSLPAAS